MVRPRPSPHLSPVPLSLPPLPISIGLRRKSATEILISAPAGPCQFPTLGFVVDQYERLQAFIPEQFWYIHLTLQKEESTVPFLWKRGRLYDEVVVEMLFDRCEEVGEVTVIRQGTKPTQKWSVCSFFFGCGGLERG